MNRHIRTVTKYLSIHPLVFAIFIAAFLTHRLKEISILYIIVMIHELFHLIAAYQLKIQVEGIKIMPFGITLKIHNNYIRKPEHEIIIAIVGPISNALMIFLGYIVKAYCLYDTDDMTFFIIANLVIGIGNMIPTLPLDGGRILKAALTLQWGFIKAFNFTLKSTKIICFLLFIAGMYILYITKFNFSLLLIATFLTFNLINERNNNNLIIMKEIVDYKEKFLKEGIFNAKNIAVLNDIPAQKILNNFSYNHFYLVTVIDSKMNIIGTLTETQIIEGLVHFGCQVKIEEILKKNTHQKKIHDSTIQI
ncbi:MAG: stage sporulation protein [Clostridiales bacterium]|nr:stage sporulation protein [Clostridiales bacterium]MDK2932978.1 stage sporulation protein [Clostridiales bacterium]